MKKVMLIGYVLILVLSLTACISSEERTKGKEQVRENKKIIKEFVRETYGKKAKATDFKTVFVWESRGSTVPNLSQIASGFVKAAVSIGDTKFDVIYHVHTKEVHTNENIPAIKATFLSYANEVLQSANLVDCEMSISSHDMLLHNIPDFVKPEIKTYEEMLSSGDYTITLTCRSINSDFDNISEERWEQLIPPFYDEEEKGTNVYMIYVNYEDEEGYKAKLNEDYMNRIYTASKNEMEKLKEGTKDIIFLNPEKGVIRVE